MDMKKHKFKIMMNYWMYGNIIRAIRGKKEEGKMGRARVILLSLKLTRALHLYY
jgi:hypothetical protein